eukprot:gene6240-6881_t
MEAKRHCLAISFFVLCCLLLCDALQVRRCHRAFPPSQTVLRCIGRELTAIPPPDAEADGLDAYWKTKVNPDIAFVETGRFSVRPTLITFDASSLIAPSQSLGRSLREALNEACGWNVRLPRPKLFAISFKKALAEMIAAHPCYGVREGMKVEDWWKQVFERTYLETRDMTLDPEEIAEVLPAAFELLYGKLFGSAEGFDVKENVVYTLSKLRDWRDQGAGPRLGVLSHWDSRLVDLLRELDLLSFFDFVLTADEGLAKPERNIFDEALKRVQQPPEAAATSFHIGDSLEEDVFGAVDAGWHALHFKENFADDFPDWDEIETPEQAEEGAKKRAVHLNWGRRQISTGREWTALWGLDEALGLFGFPADPDKTFKTTVLRGILEDE